MKQCMYMCSSEIKIDFMIRLIINVHKILNSFVRVNMLPQGSQCESVGKGCRETEAFFSP